MPFDSGAVRLARLAESLTLLNRLLSGQPSDPAGDFYQLDRAQIGPLGPQQPRPPLLIAASGPRMLELAAREADIVALGIAPTATDADLAAVVERLAAAAGERFAHLELNLNLMAVGQQVPRYLEMQLKLNASQLAAMGSAAALPGSVDKMCARLRHLRETFGISYIVVGDELMEGLAPVVERLAGT
jgi:alkanesulfonate monooxygenase SsuD/methylene tetrahydromethanopterin reductase-like flavin-dependent oxidoreductase (luciferase family)